MKTVQKILKSQKRKEQFDENYKISQVNNKKFENVETVLKTKMKFLLKITKSQKNKK